MKKLFNLLICVGILFFFSCSDTRQSEIGKRLIGTHKVVTMECTQNSNNSNVNCTTFFKTVGPSTTFLWENCNNKEITWLTIDVSKIRVIVNDTLKSPEIKFKWKTSDGSRLFQYPECIIYVVWISPRQYSPF